MARYIDVEPLEDKLKEHIKKTESELMLGALSTFLRVLDITPTADVVPVRHGHWIYDCCDIVCSECGTRYNDELCYMLRSDCSYHEPRYCLWCGARMDGEEDEID